MSNDFFSFKQFTVRHDRCAMKVGTDGTLIGAWAAGGQRVLDIGTGTGLIALMMAQRFEQAMVDAIDIDGDACAQAEDNVARSPFAARISVFNISLQQFLQREPSVCGYDAIVSNPPFFADSLRNPDARRSMARHTDSLSFADLFRGVDGLLSAGGHFSVVIPTDRRGEMLAEASIFGFHLHREVLVKTVERKYPKRCMLDFARTEAEALDSQTVVMMEKGERSEWYKALTKDFYL